jgi:hypothetical protein
MRESHPTPSQSIVPEAPFPNRKVEERVSATSRLPKMREQLLEAKFWRFIFRWKRTDKW